MLSRTPSAESHIFKRRMLRNLKTSTALTTITMINERELAINPVVQESVQHNIQVIFPPPQQPAIPFATPIANPLPRRPLTKPPTDNLQHPLPNRLLIRRRFRNPRTRIIPRLPLLPRRELCCFCPHLCLIGRKATDEIFQ